MANSSMSPLSLDSVTRVRQSGTVFSNPLANDLQKIMQVVNALIREVAALLVPDSESTPVAPSEMSDFLFPQEAAWRDDGAMDIAIEAFALASAPPPIRIPAPQIITCTQATYPSLSGQEPVFVYVTDYAHIIYWNGSAGSFVGDNPGSLSLWEVNPGTGYHLYDGSTVSYLNADGTTSSVTLPNLTSSGALAAFLEGGGTNSGPTAATAPTFTGTPGTPSGVVSAPTFTGAPKAWDVVNVSTAVATQSVLVDDATNNPYTPAGTNSAPVFTGNLLTPAGTISATGEPRKIIRRPYFRQ